MKKLVLILFTSSSFQVYAQPSILGKEWVGDNLAYLYIDSLKAFFEIFGRFHEQTSYLIKGDTLNLYYKYTSSIDSFHKEWIRNYNFIIKKHTDSTLSIVPADINAFKLSNNADVLNYRNKKALQKAKIDFDELKFRIKRSAGSYISTSVQIGKTKEIKIIETRNINKSGYYSAVLSDSLYVELLEILSVSELDKLKSWEQVVHDAPMYTLEIIYNNKIRLLTAFDAPSITNELFRFLQSIPQKVKAKEIYQPFEIKFVE